MIDIIDSYQQTTFRMTLGSLLCQFETPVTEREHVYNLVNFEISETMLERVNFVRYICFI